MALVHMKHRGIDSEGAQKPNTADPQQNLLQNPCCTVAAIDAQAQIAIVLLVFGKVSVGQIDRTAAHIHPPGLESDLRIDHWNRTHERLAMAVEHRLDRKIAGVEQRVVVDLPVVVVESLLEIPFAIKNADANEAKPKVACGFSVVASEDAEAAGRDGQRL